MALRAEIFKNPMFSKCSAGGISEYADAVTIMNVPGPAEPGEDAPGVFLVHGNTSGTVKIVPAVLNEKTHTYHEDTRYPMAGGAYVATSDSRFSEAVEKLLGQRFYGAVSLHDRFEAGKMAR